MYEGDRGAKEGREKGIRERALCVLPIRLPARYVLETFKRSCIQKCI